LRVTGGTVIATLASGGKPLHAADTIVPHGRQASIEEKALVYVTYNILCRLLTKNITSPLLCHKSPERIRNAKTQARHRAKNKKILGRVSVAYPTPSPRSEDSDDFEMRLCLSQPQCHSLGFHFCFRRAAVLRLCCGQVATALRWRKSDFL